MKSDQRISSLQAAAAALRQGDTLQAMQCYQQLVSENPRDATAYAGMGSARAVRGEYAEAIKCYINALRIERLAGWQIDLAVVYLKSKEAIAARAALASCQVALKETERTRWQEAWTVATERLKEILQRHLKPHDASISYKNLVLAYEPRASDWERVAPVNSKMADMAAAINGGKYDAAIGIGLRLFAQRPDDPALMGNIGVCFKRLLKLEQAYNLLLYALWKHPANVALLSNIGNVVCEASSGQHVVNLLEFATVLAPDDGQLWGNLSVAYHQCRKRPQETVRTARRALKLMPGQMNIVNNLANALKDQQDYKAALELYREAIDASPNDALPFHNYLLALQYADGYTADEVAHEHRRFGERFDARFSKYHGNYTNTRDSERKLRIGFVSPDLRSHAVAYFVEPLWAHLPRENFEIVAYHCLVGEDQVSRRLKQYCQLWRNVSTLDDDRLAQQIREDTIDILVDLAGHTGRNRLLVFARKPAPVQVTWLGHPNTTGLKAIDWRLTDSIGDPPGVDERYTEKLWRLPDVFVAYRPLIKAPEKQASEMYAVQSTPALKNGYVTFGSCNNLAKLTPPVVALWSRILLALPTSKLLLESTGLGQSKFREEVVSRFSKCGVPARQIECHERDYAKQYLRYNEIDIALDPFPANGGTTTCDLLWMGVPLVTMPGGSFVSRMGASLVSAAGHPEWIVKDEAEYLEKALELARDVQALERQRQTARAKIEQSPLRNETVFAQHVSDAFRTMWRLWCKEAGA